MVSGLAGFWLGGADWGAYFVLAAAGLAWIPLKAWWQSRHALHAAAAAGRVQAVAELLQRKPWSLDSGCGRDYGRTALHEAAAFGQYSVADYLLSEGADPNARSEGGWTPLHYAALTGYDEVVELLTSRGSEVAVAAEDGSTPLHCAAWRGSEACVRVLLRAGACRTAKDSEGRTAGDLAVRRRHVAVMKLLCQPNAPTEAGHGA